MKNQKRYFCFKLIIIFILALILNILLINLNFLNISKPHYSTKNFKRLKNKNESKILIKIDNKIEPRVSYDKFRRQIKRKRYDVDCMGIFEMNQIQIDKAKKLVNELRSKNEQIKLLNDSNYIFSKRMCDMYKHVRGYDSYNKYLTQMEKGFPLAYSVLTYENVEQFERLLNVIYRPQNIYCIHVDKKSDETFKKAIESITNCFDNVFITSKLEHIVYAGFSRLQADLNCMSDLMNLGLNKTVDGLKKKINYVDWKYLINMASSEFPLKTNYELVKILKMYNGSNEIEILKYTPRDRIEKLWKEDQENNMMIETVTVNKPAPHNYTVMKGLAYAAFSRQFIEYILTDQRAKDLIAWSNGTYSPDETVWATLQYNTQYDPPGGFIDKDPSSKRINTIVRFAGWGGEYECKGKYRNSVCILSIEDMPELITRNHFFVNKFLLSYDPVSYQCMEEWVHSKMKSNLTVNMYFYCRYILQHSKIANCPKFV